MLQGGSITVCVISKVVHRSSELTYYSIDVEYVNTPNTSQYVGPAQTRMIHVFNTCIAVTIRHNDCSSSIYGTSESFVTVIKEPSLIRN